MLSTLAALAAPPTKPGEAACPPSCANNPMTELLDKYCSDKGTFWQSKHHYPTAYHSIFGSLRHSIQSILEVGIGEDTSPSAATWIEYFPSAQVYLVDIKTTKEVRDRARPGGHTDGVAKHQAKFGCEVRVRARREPSGFRGPPCARRPWHKRPPHPLLARSTTGRCGPTRACTSSSTPTRRSRSSSRSSARSCPTRSTSSSTTAPTGTSTRRRRCRRCGRGCGRGPPARGSNPQTKQAGAPLTRSGRASEFQRLLHHRGRAGGGAAVGRVARAAGADQRRDPSISLDLPRSDRISPHLPLQVPTINDNCGLECFFPQRLAEHPFMFDRFNHLKNYETGGEAAGWTSDAGALPQPLGSGRWRGLYRLAAGRRNR